MNKSAIALLLAVITMPAMGITKDEQEMCEKYGNIAQSIMDNRQNGASPAALMALSDNEIVHALVTAAFDVARFQTEEFKAQSIQDFRNDTIIGCYRAFKAKAE